MFKLQIDSECKTPAFQGTESKIGLNDKDIYLFIKLIKKRTNLIIDKTWLLSEFKSHFCEIALYVISNPISSCACKQQTSRWLCGRGGGRGRRAREGRDVLWHSIERPLAIIPTTMRTTVQPRQFRDYNNSHNNKMTIEYEVSSPLCSIPFWPTVNGPHCARLPGSLARSPSPSPHQARPGQIERKSESAEEWGHTAKCVGVGEIAKRRQRQESANTYIWMYVRT